MIPTFTNSSLRENNTELISILKNKNEIICNKSKFGNRKPRKRSRIRQQKSYIPYISNKEVHNLSSSNFNNKQLALLSLGLNFIPEPKICSKDRILQDFESFANNIKLRKKIINNAPRGTPTDNISIALHNTMKKTVKIIPTTHTQIDKISKPLEDYIEESKTKINARIDEINIKQIGRKQDFDKERQFIYNQIEEIKKNKEVVIVPADKNLGVCIVNKTWYNHECYRQLSDGNSYKEITNKPDFKNILTQLKRILVIYNLCYIDQEKKKLTSLAQFLLQPLLHNFIKIGRFKIFPKVHKSPIVGRGIVSSTQHFTSFASKFLDSFLQPIMKSFNAYVKDSDNFITQLNEKTFAQDGYFLCFDVVNLYPSIDIDEGLKYLYTLLREKKIDKYEAIVKITEWVLKNNYFDFNRKTYLQTSGVAMGTSVAVTFACIYISMFEIECMKECQRKFENFNGPSIYKRFIDDGISYWENLQEANTFIDFLGNNKPNIKVTFTISKHQAIFLDLNIYKGNNFASSRKFDTTIYQKDANKYQYLPFTSYHSKPVFKAFITAELKRYIIKCSNFYDFCNIRKLFFSRLIARGYPHIYLNRIFNDFPTNIPSWKNIRFNYLEKIYRKQNHLNIRDNYHIPLVFKTVLNPLHKHLDIKSLITPNQDSTAWFDIDWKSISNNNKIIMCYRNNPKLGNLINSRNS